MISAAFSLTDKTNRHLQQEATRLYRAALRSGAIVPAEACSNCGSCGRIHGHHDDYSKPFDVIWLCPKCHHARHRETGTGNYGRPHCVVCSGVIHWHLLKAGLFAKLTLFGPVHLACFRRAGFRIQQPQSPEQSAA